MGKEVINRNDCFRQGHFPVGGRAGVLLGGGMERVHVTDSSLMLVRNFPTSISEVSVQIFCPFVYWALVFLLLTFESYLCTLNTSS